MLSPMRIKAVAFGTLAFVVPSLLLAFAVELAMRWRVTGSATGAVRSLLPETDEASGWLKPDPDLGYKLTPGRDHVNSLGIRNAEVQLDPGDRQRLIVLGDSVAFDREGFVTILAERLAEVGPAGVEVVNAAIPGYTTHQERVLFERDLAPYAPDAVMLQYCVNDNHRFLHQLDDGGHWIIVPEAVGDATEQTWLPSWLEASYIVKRIRWRQRASAHHVQTRDALFPWRDTAEFGNAWRAETWDDMEEELRALQAAAIGAGARLGIVAIPYEPQLSPEALERDDAYVLTPQRELAGIAGRLGVPFLDLHPAFASAGAEPLFRDGVHLTDRGHAIAADEIEAFLERERLLEPPEPLSTRAGP